MSSDRISCPPPGAPEEWLSHLDHTADIAIEVHANTKEMLFARCAWALFNELVDMNTVCITGQRVIHVTASDQETLLLRWLSELNYIHSVEHQLFCQFDISELTPTTLTATAFGEAIDPKFHTIRNEIKAVTYHLLKIEQRGTTWYARILFDV